MGETWYQVEESNNEYDWKPIHVRLSRYLAFKFLEELEVGMGMIKANPQICEEVKVNMEKVSYRVVKVEVCERKAGMGNRMKLKTLLEFLSKFDPESEVAYQVGGLGPDGCKGTSYRLLEVWERPVDEHPVLFLNIVAE